MTGRRLSVDIQRARVVVTRGVERGGLLVLPELQLR
jgi:hypothetical protein